MTKPMGDPYATLPQGTPHLDRCAFISNQHLTKAEIKFLVDEASTQAQSTHVGMQRDVLDFDGSDGVMLLNTDDHPESRPGWLAGMSSLIRFFDWAIKADVQMIRFDDDGDIIDEWPTYA